MTEEKSKREALFFILSAVVAAGVCGGLWWFTATEFLQSAYLGGFLHWALRWIGVAIFVGVPLAALVDYFQFNRKARQEEREEAKQAHKNRAQLRNRLRTFYFNLDDEYKWLLEYSWEEQRRWTNQPGRFVEIIEAWKREKDEFNELRGADGYHKAFADLERDSSGSVPRFSAQRLADLWDARMDLFRYARTRSRPSERTRRDMEEELATVLAEEEYEDKVLEARQEARKRREEQRLRLEARKGRPEPRPGEE